MDYDDFIEEIIPRRDDTIVGHLDKVSRRAVEAQIDAWSFVRLVESVDIEGKVRRRTPQPVTRFQYWEDPEDPAFELMACLLGWWEESNA